MAGGKCFICSLHMEGTNTNLCVYVCVRVREKSSNKVHLMQVKWVYTHITLHAHEHTHTHEDNHAHMYSHPICALRDAEYTVCMEILTRTTTHTPHMYVKEGETVLSWAEINAHMAVLFFLLQH